MRATAGSNMMAAERSDRDTGWISFQTEGEGHIYSPVSVPRIRSACQSQHEHVSALEPTAAVVGIYKILGCSPK